MEKFLKKFIWTGIPISSSAACWTLLAMNVLGLSLDYTLISLSFLLTWVSYARDRLTFSEEDLVNSEERIFWYQKYIRIPFYAIAALSFIPMVLRYEVIPLILIGGIISYFYRATIKISRNKRIRIKNVFLGKLTLVPLLWILLVVFIPAYYTGFVPVHASLFKISVYIFLIVAIQIISSDFDDVLGDTAAKVKTMPIVFGIARTRLVLSLLALISLIVGVDIFPFAPLVIYTSILIAISLGYKKTSSNLVKLLVSSLGTIAVILYLMGR